ncbi:MAG: class I SAM-dependent methyltransferase [Candidatus Eisenbacteria bacterium]|nr:class I SAM-dependent methyltransferase [Candidatus Eisenbacteria bacterium]
MTYGKDFAAIYDRRWAFWGPKMWAFLHPLVRRRLPHARSWLDLCCGTGSLLRLAKRRGYTVTGVDKSRHQIRHARKNVPGARFVRGDVRRLSLGGKFDVITCMFDSLNYLTVKRDLLTAFRGAHRHLAPRGIFAFDMNTFEGLEDRWNNTTATQDRGLTLIVENTFDAKRALGHCLITGFIRTKAGYRRFQEEHIERGYRAEDIERLLSKAGFVFKKCDGNSLGRVRKRSGRLLYVCRKRAEGRRRDS